MPELMDIIAKAQLAVQNEKPLNVATATWTHVDSWDAVPLARGDALTPDETTGAIQVNEGGSYGASLIVNCAFDKTEELYIGFSVNGADPTKWLAEQGRGANKPIDFQWYGIHDLANGDIVTVRARMETSDTEVTMMSATFTMQKEF